MADRVMPSEAQAQTSKKPTPPVVLMFQPTHYEAVPSDKLNEWEQDLVTKVGLPAETARLRTSGIGTWCGCPTFDDCDEV